MSDKRPLILVTNDDGVQARGLAELVGIASKLGDVIAVAPAQHQSAKSSALTVDGPLQINECDPIGDAKVYSVTGTPVDCVKLALHAILDRKLDMLLSGINHGSNAAVNNIYSGTMGAAMEGCIVGVPSVGFSILTHNSGADFSGILDMIETIAGRVLRSGLPAGICLNVNFPKDCVPAGLKCVRAAGGYWTEEYADYARPSGKPFYWLTGKYHNTEPDDPATDEYWLDRGWATVVPIRPDQTARDMIGTIDELLLSK
ncbi:MAG: 5'/3'-nucleotidase SurE [Muribaculaceae bacterium]|nr:5'/3'-nucleotidase SurE [Muribaculaceae bacterium]